jgi:DNA polymerase-3 subunit alpha
VTIAPNDFTHLHVHTEFSLLDGLGRIDDLTSQAVRLGFDSLAITDHGALYGAVGFVQACVAKGLKPIIGVETYVARRSMTDREGSKDSQPFHLVLLAKDWTGYQNLCRVVTDAHIDGYYYKPRIDRDYLAQHSAGLIGLSACLNGEVARALETDDWESARRIARSYSDILGPDNFYLELQDHKIPEQHRLNEKLLRLGPEMGLPLVVTNDLHYVHREQYEAHDALLCVGTGSMVEQTNRMRFETDDFYLKSAAEMSALFPDQPEAVTNSRRIAEMVDLELPFGQLRLPDFPVPDGYTVEGWLREECQRGLRRRYGTVTDELQQRLDYELGIIIQMGYAGYFLIVADFVRFARDQRIATTCRGSAPGSIVTYTLGITPVDPIHYQLPFERFLNPDRVTMPDIDVDFEDSRRDEVIAYVTRKYGSDHVAQIITFGTMLARAAIRDIGRVLGMGYGEVDRIAKAVPNQLGITLEESLQSEPLKEMYATDPTVHKLLDLAQQVEGVARNASTHAAGVVISREPLTELMPLQKATTSDALMTQYEMHGVEALGLLKFDFLGLSNLTILRQAVDLIHQERGGELIDIDRIPLDDTRTFELLSSGETTGVFQLESAGMRRYIRELRPTSVYDLAAMVALFRPGPMDNIPAYIRRKHGQEAITYLHPLLQPFMEKTYGIFVYQEDIMAAAIALGGFTGPEADTLGYAIRKKKSDVLRAQKGKFVSQAAERGVEPRVIDAVFKAFEPFERYGFNKAHATCYGLIAYQTAYLKANFPVEYMASVLTAFRDNTERVAGAVAECRRLDIAVLPPDIHTSGLHFTVEGHAIRFGLLAVKNVGQGAIESMVAARESGGDFRSLADLCARVDLRLVNKRVLESLAKVGAFSAFGHPAQVLLGLDDAIAYGQAEQRDRVSGQGSLFDDLGGEGGSLERPLGPATEAPSRERSRWEKELLGLYLSDHPLGDLATEMGRYVNAWSSDMTEELDQQRIVLGGVVTGLRRVITKSKSTMGVATLEDLQGSTEVVIFPKTFEETAGLWADDAVLLVAGRVDHKGEETVLLADSVWTWEQVLALGPDGFGPAVAAGERGRRGGRPGGDRFGGGSANGNGSGNRNGNGYRNGEARSSTGTPTTAGAAAPAAGRPPVRMPVGGDPSSSVPIPVRAQPVAVDVEPLVRTVPLVSPLRGGGVTGSVDVVVRAGSAGPDVSRATTDVVQPIPPRPMPLEPLGDLPGPPSLAGLAPDGGDEPPWPDEARADAARELAAATPQVTASAGQVLHVRFGRAPEVRVAAAFTTLREVFARHPGDTSVVLHVPAGPGREQEMQLRIGVAYDTELLADVQRRLGGVAELSLS